MYLTLKLGYLLIYLLATNQNSRISVIMTLDVFDTQMRILTYLLTCYKPEQQKEPLVS